MVNGQQSTVNGGSSQLMAHSSWLLAFGFWLLAFGFSLNANAQQVTDSLTRPRVGVVLSGGGAKGFAHIGALKVIEEAGLPIDYIAGTSMGSIIGGLYAIGYSPEMMTQLIREQNWNSIMSDDIPHKYIPIDDKILDRHYLATFPFRDKKIQMKSSIYDGCMINLLLARLVSPAYKIKDYSNLSIPFLCVATDIENAEAYEMTKGNLQRSIRASMSIPFYFSPVEVDGRLLIDGGLRNNFPVPNVREKDIDIIIGVDVQRNFHTKEEINSMAIIMDQIIAMSDIDAYSKAKEESDIYIKPELTKYGMMDFNSYDTIIAIGEATAREYLPMLKRLADSIRNIQDYKIERQNIAPLDSIYVVSLKIYGVDEENAGFLKKSIGKNYPSKIAINDIETSIMSIMATGYYKDIWYDLVPTVKGVNLVIHCKEKEEESVSIAAHYDTDYGIGILTNITFKNILRRHKRSTISIDLNIAEDPYFKFCFHSGLSQKFKYGTDLSVISLFMNQYYDRTINNSYSVQDNKIDLFMEYMPTLERQFRVGIVGNYVHLRDNLIHVVASDDYDFIANAYVNYHIDNENSTTYASRGWKLNLNAQYLLPFIKNEDGSAMGSSLILKADFNGSIAIGAKHSLKIGATAGTSFAANEVPLSYRFFVGGQSHMKYFSNIISFEGLRFTQLYGNNIAIGKISWQYNFYRNIYATANFNGGYVADEHNTWFSSDNFTLGYGLTLGMETKAGPIEVSLMGSNRCSNLIGFFNIGYWF